MPVSEIPQNVYKPDKHRGTTTNNYQIKKKKNFFCVCTHKKLNNYQTLRSWGYFSAPSPITTVKIQLTDQVPWATDHQNNDAVFLRDG